MPAKTARQIRAAAIPPRAVPKPVRRREPRPFNPHALWWRLGDVAVALSVSTSFVKKQVRAGQFPQPIRMGAAVRWPRSVIEEVAAGTWRPGGDAA